MNFKEKKEKKTHKKDPDIQSRNSNGNKRKFRHSDWIKASLVNGIWPKFQELLCEILQIKQNHVFFFAQGIFFEFDGKNKETRNIELEKIFAQKIEIRVNWWHKIARVLT